MALGAFCFKLGQEWEKENELLGSPNQAIKLLCKGFFYFLGVWLLYFFASSAFMFNVRLLSLFSFILLLSSFNALLLERKYGYPFTVLAIFDADLLYLASLFCTRANHKWKFSSILSQHTSEFEVFCTRFIFVQSLFPCCVSNSLPSFLSFFSFLCHSLFVFIAIF